MTHRLISLTLLVLSAFSIADAKISLPSIISDHMVVRSGNEARLYGKATPGATVTVTPSWTSTQTTVAGDDGNWEVMIQPGKASKQERSITFADDNSTVTVNDVLVGEVWLCTGQSNMVFPVGNHTDSLVWQTGMIDADEQLKDATFTDLRLFKVKQTLSTDKKLDDVIGKWVKATPESVYGFSAVGFIFGRRLLKELDRPVGLIQSAVGATSIESWINPELQTDTIYDYMKRKFVTGKVSKRNAHRISGGLWNGMIYPLNRYQVTGTIWYQGEGNAINARNYLPMMKTMVNHWRADRRQPDMPFYYVQIAPFHDRSPYIREAQLQFLQSGIKNVGMAVVTDAGDSLDIHPRNKVIPGERLALIALDKTYGKNVESDSPTMKKVTFNDNEAVVTFNHGKGLTTNDGKAPAGFKIAGDDMVWYNATARIENGKVIVSSPDVARPTALRYGFENFPRVNLMNEAGLPASPFRTK
ncbi:MAG: Ig-like domain-containing protein [Muribaculaceae bacterium]|nr:Ig-like domain-containing protein [Muribaculaceae bacterium]